MSLFLNIISALLVLACLFYIIIKKDKNIIVMVLSGLILIALLSQIVFDEVVSRQVFAMENVNRIKISTAIVQIINWVKGGLIFFLAMYYYYISAEPKKKAEEEK